MPLGILDRAKLPTRSPRVATRAWRRRRCARGGWRSAVVAAGGAAAVADGGGGGGRRSDIALKHDIVPLGHLANGLGYYRFSYNGSDRAYVGVMAQEVQEVMPEAVMRDRMDICASSMRSLASSSRPTKMDCVGRPVPVAVPASTDKFQS